MRIHFSSIKMAEVIRWSRSLRNSYCRGLNSFDNITRGIQTLGLVIFTKFNLVDSYSVTSTATATGTVSITILKLYNAPTFILALATSGTNSRSKKGGTKQSTRT